METIQRYDHQYKAGAAPLFYKGDVMQPKSKTLLEALATNQPQILASLATKWGVVIPTNKISRDYWQLVVDLAQHALEADAKNEPGKGWYNADFSRRSEVEDE